MKILPNEIRSHVASFTLLGVLVIVSSVISVYPILLMQRVIDLAVSTDKKQLSEMILIGFIYIGFQLINALTANFAGFYARKLQAKLSCKMQISIFNTFQTVDLSSFLATDSSAIRDTIMQDSQVVCENLVVPFVDFLKCVLTFIFGLLFMTRINVALTFLVFPLALASAIVVKGISARYEKSVKKHREQTVSLWKVYSEGIQGFLPIRLHHYWEEYLKELETSSANLCKTQLEQAWLEKLRSFLSSVLFMSTIGLIMIFASIFVSKGLISIGGLTAILMYNHMLVDPLIQLQEIFTNLAKRKVSLDRLNNLLSLPKRLSLPQKESKIRVERISIDHICFDFFGKSVIQDSSCKLDGDFPIWILGESGTGKTTLVNLLAGVLLPKAGRIFYECENRMIENPQICYMLQDEYVFDRSIRENIRIGNKNISEDEISEIIQVAELSDVFMRHGDAALGENGSHLSGGERKRVLIARVLANTEADIYVFDELSSSLDQNTYASIFRTIEKRLDGKMRIYIEHNQSMVSPRDTIVSVNNQRVVVNRVSRED